MFENWKRLDRVPSFQQWQEFTGKDSSTELLGFSNSILSKVSASL